MILSNLPIWQLCAALCAISEAEPRVISTDAVNAMFYGILPLEVSLPVFSLIPPPQHACRYKYACEYAYEFKYACACTWTLMLGLHMPAAFPPLASEKIVNTDPEPTRFCTKTFSSR